ncbi:MAG: phospholipid-binding protein MlaC [Thiotrichales bacterium]
MTMKLSRVAFATALLTLTTVAVATPYAPPGLYGMPEAGPGYPHQQRPYYPRPPMPHAAPQAQAQPAQPSPLDLLRQGIDATVEFLGSEQARDRGAIEGFVAQSMSQYFDFDRMAQLVGGRVYRELDQVQRAAFQGRLQGMFLSAFVGNLAGHAGKPPQVDFLPVRRVSEDEVNAYARVRFADNSTSRLVFRFGKSGESWKVFDVAADGSSAVLYYRSHFLAQGRQQGPQGLMR